MKRTVEELINSVLLELDFETDGDERDEWTKLLIQTRGDAPELDETLDTIVALKRSGGLRANIADTLIIRHYDESHA